MATSKKDGGPAFASPGVYVDENQCPREMEAGQAGMSLRDWFAGQIAAALITASPHNSSASAMANLLYNLGDTAYQYADKLIEARDK